MSDMGYLVLHFIYNQDIFSGKFSRPMKLSQQDTGKQRQNLIFDKYCQAIKEELYQNPRRTQALSKSFFYNLVADDLGYNSVYVGRVVQLKLRQKGILRTRASEIMDEEIRFILSL